jgi:Right handed beta helix region
VAVTGALRLLRVSCRRKPAAGVAVLAAGLLMVACDGGSADGDAVTTTPPATTTPRENGATFYVDPQGDDEGAGTMARPWRTIDRAASELDPGDVVLVRAGTYPGDVNIARSGSGDAPVTVKAFPGERPRLTGRLKVEADHVVVSGFVIEGRTPTNPTDVAVYVSKADDVRIVGNEVTRAGQSGIFVGDGSTRTQIVSNWIHENGRNDFLDHGIYVEHTEGTLIANNLIEANVGYGVQLYPNADESVVTQNTIVRNGRSGVIVGGEDTRSDGNTIVNNIVCFNGEQGIRTFWGGPVGLRNVASNNLVYGNPQGVVVGKGLRVSGTLTDHPGFVDAPRGDYRLQADSPAVDGATVGTTMPSDRDGRRRPQGAAPDLGAFEL